MAIRSGSVKGLDELIKATSEIAPKAMPELRFASISAAKLVLSRAKQLAPIGSDFTSTGTDQHNPGFLRDSLKLSRTRLKAGDMQTFAKVVLGKGAAYGIPVELGHALRKTKKGKAYGRVDAKPFLRPAADQSKGDVADIIVKSMNSALEKWGDKK